MAEILRYLLLANIFLGLLSLFFRLFLSKEKWLQTNRIVLLAGIGLALIIPLINFNILPSPEQALIVIPEILVNAHTFKPDFVLEEIQIIGTAPLVFPWISLLKGLYLLGAMIMFVLFLHRISSIRMLQKTQPMKWFSQLFITLLPPNSPSFSFLGTVYHPGPLNREDKLTRLILEHERVHINQKHSWDLIFVEIIQLLFFYNPAVYTLRKQLILTHEFIADQIVAKQDQKQYSLALFQSFFNVPHFTLSHAFNQSTSLKKRIIMLQKHTHNRWAACRYFLLVPMIGTFMLLSAFTTVNAQEKKTKEEIAKEVVAIKLKEAGFDKKDIEEINARIDQTSKHKTTISKNGQDGVFFIVEDMPTFDGKGLDHFRKWVQSQIKYPAKALKKNISGTVYSSFIINEEGKVESIKIVRGVHKLLDNEAIRVLKSAPAWIPGKQRGKSVSVSMAIPIHFKLK